MPRDLWLSVAKHFQVVLPAHLSQRGIQTGAPETHHRKTWPKAEPMSADTGDAKTCLVDFRVETFNFANLVPTVQSRRDRDKKGWRWFQADRWLMLSFFRQWFSAACVVWCVGDFTRFYISIFVLVYVHIYIFIYIRTILHARLFSLCRVFVTKRFERTADDLRDVGYRQLFP